MTRILPVLIGLIALAAPAGAVRIAGGGPPRSDCYLELDVQGATRLSTRAAECTDGDPTCDGDGACDGTCRFAIATCLNQSDPALPNCTPPFPPSALLLAGERGKDPIGLAIPSFASSACGAFVNVDVPVTRRARPGRRIVAVAVSSSRPKRDRDVVRLFCRRPAGGCPTTTTTTTPTTSTTGETTTTLNGQQLSLAPTADTGIFSGAPDSTLGTLNQVFVGNDASNSQRALLRFDLTGIPANAIVTACTLDLNVVTLNEAGPGKVYRVKQPAWTEAGATWNSFDGVTPWTTAGTYDPTEASSDVVVTAGPDGPIPYAAPERTGAFLLPDLTALCQDAVANRDGDLNLFLKQDVDAPGSTAELSFSRRTDSEEAERPTLVVHWAA